MRSPGKRRHLGYYGKLLKPVTDSEEGEREPATPEDRRMITFDAMPSSGW
jgi:hypothetical protein